MPVAMLAREKISIGRLRQAYELSDHEVEALIQALWPDKVFPVELWRRAHEKFWKDFASGNQKGFGVENPSLPEPDLTKSFQTYLFSLDIMSFFRTLSTSIHAHALELGLDFILEESCQDKRSVFPEERRELFNMLAENIGYSPNDYFCHMKEKHSRLDFIAELKYHFIASIFSDTILVDKIAAIRYLRDYPVREVKGITRRLVESVLSPPTEVLSSPAEIPTPPAEVPSPTTEVPMSAEAPNQTTDEAPTPPEIPSSPAEAPTPQPDPPAEQGERPEEGNSATLVVPRLLWAGKPAAAVRDAMKEEFALSVIAFVLVKWCGISKTQAGRLLSDRQYADDKSYRNLIDGLLKKAAELSIVTD